MMTNDSAKKEQAELRRQVSRPEKTSLVVRKTLCVEVDNFVVGEDASGVGTEF